MCKSHYYSLEESQRANDIFFVKGKYRLFNKCFSIKAFILIILNLVNNKCE